MLEIGKKYSFAWAEDGGTRYERGTVLDQNGTVIKVQLDTRKQSVINMATPAFIRAEIVD